jgi:hypothetical protein
MAYIGKTPVIGNFVKLDSITVVNGQAAYTMQNGGVNFTSYDNVNQFLVSLNGVLQAPELASEPADTDEFLVSDAGTIKRIDYSLIKGGGKINQVLFNDAVVNTTTSSDVEIISKAITPSATSSKILIIAAFSCQLNSDEYASFDIYRGSLASGTKILDGGEQIFSAANNVRLWSSFTMLDSPSTTSATTYTIVGSPLASGTIQFGAGGRQTLTLMEVLA